MTLSPDIDVTVLMGAATRRPGILGAASAYHLSTGGQGWRSSLVMACGSALRMQPGACMGLAAACELVHQASIVHDDVQDDASTRRGLPSVAARYGSPIAICVGDHLLACAFGLLGDLPSAPSLIALFADRLADMAGAQAEELDPAMWDSMTQARYAAIAAGKVGAMVALTVESVACLGGLTGAELIGPGRAARLLGMAYQAGDDLDDLAADLHRGALNGVIAFALGTSDGVEREKLLQLLARARDQGLGPDEAQAYAARLSPVATHLSAWAMRVLGEASGAVAGHRLEPVMTAAVNTVARRIRGRADVTECAA